MKKRKEGLAIFDFDGVFNKGSQDSYYEGYYVSFEAVRAEIPPEQQRKRIEKNWGSAHRVIIANVLQDQPHLIRDATDIFEEYMRTIFPERITGVDGSPDMLGRLTSKYTLALNTAAPRDILLDVVMPKLGIDPSLFSGGIVTADQLNGIHAKPSPYVIQFLKKLHGYKEEDTVMVGDSMADMESARAAQVEPIAITATGNLSESAVRELEWVKYSAETVVEVEDLLPEVFYRTTLGKLGIGPVKSPGIKMPAAF